MTVNSRADVTNTARLTENSNIHANFDFVGDWKELTEERRSGSLKPAADPNRALQDALSKDIYATDGGVRNSLLANRTTTEQPRPIS
jgi:hypothetical protein